MQLIATSFGIISSFTYAKVRVINNHPSPYYLLYLASSLYSDSERKTPHSRYSPTHLSSQGKASQQQQPGFPDAVVEIVRFC